MDTSLKQNIHKALIRIKETKLEDILTNGICQVYEGETRYLPNSDYYQMFNGLTKLLLRYTGMIGNTEDTVFPIFVKTRNNVPVYMLFYTVRDIRSGLTPPTKYEIYPDELEAYLTERKNLLNWLINETKGE